MNVVQAASAPPGAQFTQQVVRVQIEAELVITLAAAGGAAAATGGAARFAEGRSDVPHALKDVNFRRGRVRGRISSSFGHVYRCDIPKGKR